MQKKLQLQLSLGPPCLFLKFKIGLRHCLFYKVKWQCWLGEDNEVHDCHALLGPSPTSLADLCRPVASVGSRQRLRSATRGDLVVSPTVTHFGARSFAVAGPKAWNYFPADICGIVYIPQGSVATQLRCGGLFNNHFRTTFFLHSVRVNFLIWSIFRDDIDKSYLVRFYGPRCTCKPSVKKPFPMTS